MNKKQKILAGIGLAAFATTLFCAPWTVTHLPSSLLMPTPTWTRIETSPIWDSPTNGQLNIGVLLAEWFSIGVLDGGLILLLREKQSLKTPN